MILGCVSKNFQTDWLLSCFIPLRARLSELQAEHESVTQIPGFAANKLKLQVVKFVIFESLVSILGRYLR